MKALVFLAASVLAAAPGPSGFKDLDEAGFRRQIEAARGAVVLVNFWATWCAPCRAEMPALVKLEAKLRNRGFRLLTVSADEPEQQAAALAFLRKTGVPAPWFFKRAANDEKFINAIDPKWSGALPASFLFDRKGRKAGSFVGEVNLAELEKSVEKLL